MYIMYYYITIKLHSSVFISCSNTIKALIASLLFCQQPHIFIPCPRRLLYQRRRTHSEKCMHTYVYAQCKQYCRVYIGYRYFLISADSIQFTHRLMVELLIAFSDPCDPNQNETAMDKAGHYTDTRHNTRWQAERRRCLSRWSSNSNDRTSSLSLWSVSSGQEIRGPRDDITATSKRPNADDDDDERP